MKWFSLTLAVLLFVSGCYTGMQKQTEYCGCNTEEPSDGLLTVYFTRTEEQRSPDILLLSGFYEENQVMDTIPTDTVPAYRNYTAFSVPVDHYYTVVAVYYRDSDTIYAIDGDYLAKQRYYDADCDTICWKISGNNLNVKLKNH